MLAERILKFGEKFRARLELIHPDLLFGALDYVSHGEERLAFETLCEHICEYDIHITEGEYNEAVQLASDLKLDLNDLSLKCMARLIAL
jgi:hypothetical protein